ncbi:YlbF family regulator [Agrilactobacillus fermenti]|uniref:YlbF family regulator n=1 Tax=Agrilactobacillus fermenti TaxID=2586909 RepID=UPI003A5C550A
MADKQLDQQLAALPADIRQALTAVTEAIAAVPTIQTYQQIEAQVKHNRPLQKQQQQLERAQKEIVAYQRIQKNKAALAAKTKADHLEKAIETDPLTIAYRQSLYEANELLEYMTHYFQAQLDKILADKDQ